VKGMERKEDNRAGWKFGNIFGLDLDFAIV
jgi:hypothetical protein